VNEVEQRLRDYPEDDRGGASDDGYESELGLTL
jgi:hypothetical protein